LTWNLSEIAVDANDLLVGGLQFRLTDKNVARQLCLGAVNVLQRERTVKTILCPVPDVTERDLLHRQTSTPRLRQRIYAT